MNKKQKEKTSGIVLIEYFTILIVGFVLLNRNMDMPDWTRTMSMVVVLIISLLVISAAKKKEKQGKKDAAPTVPKVELHRDFPDPKAKAARQPSPLFRHKDENMPEEAVHCHHLTGKEKYIQQLDSYLKAGLIDRAEYKVMKERYSKLDIPEDYH